METRSYLWRVIFFLLSLHDHFTVHTVCWIAFSVKYDPVLDFLQSMCSALFYASGSFIKIMSLSRYWNIALWRILVSFAFCWRGIWHSSWINHPFFSRVHADWQMQLCAFICKVETNPYTGGGQLFQQLSTTTPCMVGCFSTYKQTFSWIESSSDHEHCGPASGPLDKKEPVARQQY